MNFPRKIERVLKTPLKTFIIFERIIASVCILIPVILKLYDKDCPRFRYSISKYAYMSNSYIYGMLLCMAAMLFIFNGAVYFKSEADLKLDKNGKWYNVVLGISLIGVILFPPLKYVLLHRIFGAIFFMGNAFVIGFFQKKNRIVGITLAIVLWRSLVHVHARLQAALKDTLDHADPPGDGSG